MERARRAGFPWTPYVVALAIIAVIALFPVISVWLAYAIAEPNGCRVDEAGVYPCIVNGADIGGLLAFMALLGWLMLATIPFGAMALLLWAVVLVAHLIYRRTKAARSGSSS